MQHSMTTRRRKALTARKLLHLPDELLSMIMMEAMWACTLPEELKENPDLESYQRRLTNHPSVQKEKVLFLGGICGQLRGIYQELIEVPSLWTSPGWSQRQHRWYDDDDDEDEDAMDLFAHLKPSAALPHSLVKGGTLALTLVRDEMGYLHLLPAGTFSCLTELELYGRERVLPKEVAIPQLLSSCSSLRTLRLDALDLPDSGGLIKMYQVLAKVANLRHLAIHYVHEDTTSSPFIDQQLFSKAVASPWPSLITRLEITYSYHITFSHFVRMMNCSASSLAVAIFATARSVSHPMADVLDLVEFPSLWKLSIGFQRRHAQGDFGEDTPAGRDQLAIVSPLEAIKRAPRLTYFDCSQPVVIGTRAELAEAEQLVERDGWKRMRLRLKTWKGDKGARWTEEEMQDVLVG